MTCQRSFALDLLALTVLASFHWVPIDTALAQTAEPQPPNIGDVRDAMRPVTDLVVWPFAMLAKAGWYVVRNPSLAVLLSALSAAVFATIAIRRQAATTRLRETFATVNRDNWDDDLIKARRLLRKVKNDLAENPGMIARYVADRPEEDKLVADTPQKENAKSQQQYVNEFIETKITLQTIMNDYEGIALGVRLGILDEKFLFKYMKSTVLSDWRTLAPLVNAYRQTMKNQDIYVEFEGLANQWHSERSYCSGLRAGGRGRKLNTTKKQVLFR